METKDRGTGGEHTPVHVGREERKQLQKVATAPHLTHPIHLYQESAQDAVERLFRRRVVASMRSDTLHLCTHRSMFRGNNCQGEALRPHSNT